MTRVQQEKKSYIFLIFLLSLFFVSQCQLDTTSTKRGTQSLKGVHDLAFSELSTLKLGDQFTTTLRVTARAPITKGYISLDAPRGLTLVKGNSKEILETLTIGQTVTYPYTFTSSQQGCFILGAYLVEPLEGGQMVTATELQVHVGEVTPDRRCYPAYREEEGLYIQDLNPTK